MEEFLKPLLTNAGVAGIILAWHLLVVGKRMSMVEEALNRLTRSNLLRLVASPGISPEVKAEVAGLLEETDSAETERKKRIV